MKFIQASRDNKKLNENKEDKIYTVREHPIYGKIYTPHNKQGLLNFMKDFEDGKID